MKKLNHYIYLTSENETFKTGDTGKYELRIDPTNIMKLFLVLLWFVYISFK